MVVHAWAARAHVNGSLWLSRTVEVTVRRSKLDNRPVIGQHMSNADIWRIINVGV